MVLNIIYSLVSLVGCIASIIYSNKLTSYRIQQLEIKVDRHNNLIERLYKLEESTKDAHYRINEIIERIDNFD